MSKMLCVMDSVGKTAGKGQNRQYWKDSVWALQKEGIAVTVVFWQGATVQQLVELAEANWNQEFHHTMLISFGNNFFTAQGVHITEQQWQAEKERIVQALQRFSRNCRSPVQEVVLGGDATQWQVQNPATFQERVQSVFVSCRDLSERVKFTDAKEWVSGLDASHWDGFHLKSGGTQRRDFASDWLANNIKRSWRAFQPNPSCQVLPPPNPSHWEAPPPVQTPGVTANAGAIFSAGPASAPPRREGYPDRAVARNPASSNPSPWKAPPPSWTPGLVANTFASFSAGSMPGPSQREAFPDLATSFAMPPTKKGAAKIKSVRFPPSTPPPPTVPVDEAASPNKPAQSAHSAGPALPAGTSRALPADAGPMPPRPVPVPDAVIPTDHVRGTVSADANCDAPMPQPIGRPAKYSRLPKTWYMTTRVMECGVRRWCWLCNKSMVDDDSEKAHLQHPHHRNCEQDQKGPWNRFTRLTLESIALMEPRIRPTPEIMFNATELAKEVEANGGVMKPFWPGDDADDVDLEEKPRFLDIEDLKKSAVKPFWMYPERYPEFQGETSAQKERRKKKEASEKWAKIGELNDARAKIGRPVLTKDQVEEYWGVLARAQEVEMQEARDKLLGLDCSSTGHVVLGASTPNASSSAQPAAPTANEIRPVPAPSPIPRLEPLAVLKRVARARPLWADLEGEDEDPSATAVWDTAVDQKADQEVPPPPATSPKRGYHKLRTPRTLRRWRKNKRQAPTYNASDIPVASSTSDAATEIRPPATAVSGTTGEQKTDRDALYRKVFDDIARANECALPNEVPPPTATSPKRGYYNLKAEAHRKKNRRLNTTKNEKVCLDTYSDPQAHRIQEQFLENFARERAGAEHYHAPKAEASTPTAEDDSTAQPEARRPETFMVGTMEVDIAFPLASDRSVVQETPSADLPMNTGQTPAEKAAQTAPSAGPASSSEEAGPQSQFDAWKTAMADYVTSLGLGPTRPITKPDTVSACSGESRAQDCGERVAAAPSADERDYLDQQRAFFQAVIHGTSFGSSGISAMQKEIKSAAKYLLRWRGLATRWSIFEAANRVDLASQGYGPTCPRKLLGRVVDGAFKLGWQCSGHADENPPTDFFPIHSDIKERQLEALTHYHIFDEVSRALDEDRILELWSEPNTAATPYMREMASRILDKVYGKHDFTDDALRKLPYYPSGLERKRRRRAAEAVLDEATRVRASTAVAKMTADLGLQHLPRRCTKLPKIGHLSASEHPTAAVSMDVDPAPLNT